MLKRLCGPGRFAGQFCVTIILKKTASDGRCDDGKHRLDWRIERQKACAESGTGAEIEPAVDQVIEMVKQNIFTIHGI